MANCECSQYGSNNDSNEPTERKLLCVRNACVQIPAKSLRHVHSSIGEQDHSYELDEIKVNFSLDPLLDLHRFDCIYN